MNANNPTDPIPEQLFQIQQKIFNPLHLQLKNLLKEKESGDYMAHRFELNQLKIRFRCAKITPTKIGQFVTLWKRRSDGPIEPFHESDDLDLVIILTCTENYSGLFVFTKAVLSKVGYLSNTLKEGKRGFRVYPPWDITLNPQAQKTQKWQLDYFLNMPLQGAVDVEKAKKLYF